MTNHIVGLFDSETGLRAKALQSLYELVTRGVVDTTPDTDDEPKAVDISIPKPPDIYSLPPYILTNTFIGREQELKELDNWASSDKPMMVIEGIGGMGKSALTWHWVNERSSQFDGIFWYSFYEGGTTLSQFLRYVLAYITENLRIYLKLQEVMNYLYCLMIYNNVGNFGNSVFLFNAQLNRFVDDILGILFRHEIPCES